MTFMEVFFENVDMFCDVHGIVHSKCGQMLTTCSDVFTEDHIQTGQALGWMFVEAFMQTVNKLTLCSGFLGIVHASAVDIPVQTVMFTEQGV